MKYVPSNERLTNPQGDDHPLAVFIIALVCASLGFYFPELGFWPLLFAILAILFSALALHSRPVINLPMVAGGVIFLASALVGQQISSAGPQSWIKLYAVAGAVLVYYVAMQQRRGTISAALSVISIWSAFLTVYFLLTDNWTINPTEFDIVNRMGEMWMGVRPVTGLHSIPDDIVSGALAIGLPLQIAAIFAPQWFGKRLVARDLDGVCLAISLVGVFMTGSRAGWMGAGLGMTLMGVYALASRWRRAGLSVLLWGTAGVVVWLCVLTLVFPGYISSLAADLGYWSFAQRFGLFKSGIDIIFQAPFTGVGLGAFPGVYSRYILGIPYLMFEYAHHFWLDVYLNQGVAGVLALLWMVYYALSRFVWRPVFSSAERSPGLLQWALCSGMAVAAIHGFLEDGLYGVSATPILLLLPGLLVAGQQDQVITAVSEPDHATQKKDSISILARVAVFPVLGALVFLGYRPVYSMAVENAAALKLFRLELAGWPEQELDIFQPMDGVDALQGAYQEALAVDPHNEAARYHLGLIAMRNLDFATASQYFAVSIQSGRDFPALVKYYAYSLVWKGDWETALPYLQATPDAIQELSTYSWWWGSQGYPDLAHSSQQATEALQRGQEIVP
ncbi:MAG: O-antigen ligase family protein [Chloroflexi bacterium]|nr:O-antigen ligase family protein [Chloroflexota bacterium]